MRNLDKINYILKFKNQNKVIQSIDNFDKQISYSFYQSQKIPFYSSFKKVNKIVVCGMGGSRFPALIVRELFKDKLKLPIIINDDYILPSFVDQKTLLIASSYSGTTEEVLENLRQGLIKKAKILIIASGGDLAKISQEKKLPAYIFDPINNPSSQPRLGFGYNIGALLGILMKLNFLKEKKENIKKAIIALSHLTKNFKVDVLSKNNFAKQLAEKIFNHYPYYVVGEFLTGWGNAIANQTNETTKNISNFRVIPELNHHLMEGLKHPKEIKKLLIFVFFYSSLYSLPVQKRFYITKEVVEKNNIKSVWVEIKGKNKIEQVFYAISLSNYLTFYLSTLYQEDPTIIPFVDYFKKRLKEK